MRAESSKLSSEFAKGPKDALTKETHHSPHGIDRIDAARTSMHPTLFRVQGQVTTG
jgi:hypothetical protein